MSPEHVALSYTPARSGGPASAGYMAGLPRVIWIYARVAYMGDRQRSTLDALARRVNAELWARWPMIGRRPASGAALERYRAHNEQIVERLARIAVAECVSPAVAGSNKASWRADQLGVTERRWHQAYRQPYEQLMVVIREWDREFRRTVWKNQALDNPASPGT